MIDEIKLRKDAAKGERAKALLENELLAEAFTLLKADYVAKWEATTADEQFLREKYWLANRVVGVVENHLHNVIANGSLAQADLRNITQLAEQQKTWAQI